MLENLSEILTKKCNLDPRRSIIVGVSGGPDSLSLLHNMHVLGYQLFVAHLDHGLRPESVEDAQKVKEISTNLGLVFELEKEDVGRYAKENGLSTEEAARERRYSFLFNLAEKYAAQAVAVGHNADDQVETVLMHLLRGAGLDGLSGMQMHSINTAWSNTIPLVRPLLSTWREEIVAYCEANELEPIFDQSNSDIAFFRNRLRQELLPNLESYNPQVRTQLWRMAETLEGDQQIVEGHIDAVWKEMLSEEFPDHLALDRQAFLNVKLGVQRRLIRRALTILRPGLRDLDFATISRAIDAIQDPPASRQIDLMAGLRLVVEEGRIWLAGWEAELPVSSDWPQTSTNHQIDINDTGELAIGSHWRLKVEQLTSDQIDPKRLSHTDPFEVWLAVENLDQALLIRARQPGDRFAPLGMDGHSLKLSDFFINEKLPKRARDGWPLLFIGDEIAWIPGFRSSHKFRVKETSEKIFHIRLYRQE